MKPEAERARPKPSVCRRLFADDDAPDQGLRDNMFNQLTEQINRNLDDACKKYNFDFRSEVPLDGDWAWERIVSEDDASHARAESLEAPVTTEPRGDEEDSKERSVQTLPTSGPQAPSADPLQPPKVPQ